MVGVLVFDAVRGDGDEPRAPLSVQDQGLGQICFSLFPVASKGLPRCGAVWGHLKFQWFWSLAG